MDTTSTDNLNEARLKKMLVNLEMRYNENQKVRIKHEGNPVKYASSETELFAALDELSNVATQPELYHVLISKKPLSTIVSLLMHDNTDISAKVIAMLQEFTDIEETDNIKSYEALINALEDENVVDTIISNLGRLDEKIIEEAEAIVDSLSIIENLVNFNLDFATTCSKKLIEWMMKELKKNPEFNSIKLSIADLLSLLLVSAPENKIYLSESNGIDIMLQQVAYYRRVAPTTVHEHEFLEQVISCLCTAILDCEENRQSFFNEEGIDLIELILREKREPVKNSNIKLSMLKLLSYVLTTTENHNKTVISCCERFIQVLGLRVLFPIFNNPKLVLSTKVEKRNYHHVLDEVEEYTSSILLALLKNCQDPVLIQRILVKFAESNFEKLNRLVAMHDKYFKLISLQQNENGDNETSVRASVKSGTHFTLITIDYIILLVCYLSNHFEVYDPSSGETFANCISNLIGRRPELKHQILFEARKHIDEVDSCSEEQNSLQLLIDHFEKQSKRNQPIKTTLK